MDSSWQENATFSCETLTSMKKSTLLIGEVRTHFVLLVPITLITLLTLFFQFLLKPLGQFAFVSQMLAGIAIGPSFLEQSKRFSKKIFPLKATIVLKVFEATGFIFLFFTLTARIDKAIFKRSGRLAIVIGIGSYFLPLIATIAMCFFLNGVFYLDYDLRRSLLAIAAVESTTSFHVIFALLTDLKLLNSDLGRVALSSSFISNLLSWFLPELITFAIDETSAVPKNTTLWRNVSSLFMVTIIVFAIRPWIFWMMKQTPEGKALKCGHFLAITAMVLGCALFGEFTGQHSILGPLILGLSIPVSPPLGPLLVDKIQYFVWAVFMPCFIINTGRRIDLFSIRFNSFLAVELLIFVSTFVKLFVIIIPSLYFKIPIMDALSLGLVLNCRGIYDIQLFTRAKNRKVITAECYGIMVLTAMLQSTIVIPLVRVISDSSRRYAAYRNLTIQNYERQSELRLLVCIHELDNVPTILNILQASNPPRNHVGICVMNLEEYIGLSMPLIIPHHNVSKLPTSNDEPNKIDPIISSFYNYQRQNRGFMSVQVYTAISSYASMHDDICSMAFRKNTSLMIIPFKKTNNPFMKKVVNNILKMTPCSVALLFDRGVFGDILPIFTRKPVVNVCVLFFGGPDDREALAYGSRMAKNPSINLRVIRFIAISHSVVSVLIDENQDLAMINEFRRRNVNKKNVEYIELGVKEGCETATIIYSIGNGYELILVGRRHDINSQVLVGLVEKREIKEMGLVGDFLASTDLVASVMVIQQQEIV